MHTRIGSYCLAIMVVCGWVSVPAAHAQSRGPLFGAPPRAAAARAADRPDHRPQPRRSRTAALRVDALAPLDGGTAIAEVELNLFDDVQVVADVEQFEQHGPGTFTWKGRLRGVPEGHATFVSSDGIVAGTVFGDGAVYEVTYAGDGAYDIRELDPAAFPSDDPPSDLDLSPVQSTQPASPVAAGDSAAQIDVMVVWTPAAESAAGGVAAMRSLVDLAVSNANTAYANSGISTRLRLVHKAQVPYTESASISTDLSRLVSGGDGYLDSVQSLRDQYGADVVSLFGSGYTSSSGACGIGYLMSFVSTSFASNAFNVVDYSCAAGNLSFAHEVGHNEGMHHDPANASGTPAYSYSYGYVDPSCAFRTVMAYGGCQRVTQFSSPNVLYNGRVTGTSTQNNALTLNNTAATVSNFRQAVAGCTYALASPSWSASSGGASSSVGVTVTGSGCSWTAASSAPSWLTITAGASGTGSATISFSAAANTSASARSATITAGGQTFTVNQAASTCSYGLSPSSWTAPSAGGSSSLVLTVTGSTCSWTASSAAPAWLTITGGGNGSTSGTVSFSATANPNSTSRTAKITAGGKTFTVTQPGIPCSYGISSSAFSTSSTATASSVSVSAVGGCGWTASSGAGWVTVTSGTSGTGNGTVGFSVAANPSSAARNATLTVAGHPVAVSQAGAACTYTLSASSYTAPAAGISSTVALTSVTGCAWNAVSNAAWLTLSTASNGTGNASIGFRAAANNTGTTRTATLTIAGKTLTVTQPAAPCAYTVSPSTITLGASGGNPPVSVITGTACGWTATSAASWVTVTSGATGTGIGNVALTAAPNMSASGRSASVKVAGKAITISQAGAVAVQVKSLTSNRAYPLKPGVLTTWTTVASGGVTALQYQYWRYSAKTAAWTVVRDWSADSTFAWTPTAAEAGSYVLQAWVRQTGSTAKYDAWAGTPTFAVTSPSTAPVTVSSLTSSVALPTAAGTSMTWTAAAAGGSGPLEYEFWLYNGQAWSIARSYASSNQFVWTPAASGKYALQVWVRQVGNTSNYDAWLGSGYVTITAGTALSTPVSSVTLAADHGLPVSAGTALAWTGTASGSDIEYEFWLYDGAAWVVAQEYSPSRTLLWTPDSSGSYAVQVWARTVGSTDRYQAWASSGMFTVTP